MNKEQATVKELQLLFFVQKNHGAVCASTKMPQDYSHLNMNVLRSCEKKGYLREVDSGFSGMWELTEKGKVLLSQSIEPLPPLTTSVLMNIFQTIKLYGDDSEGLSDYVDETIKKYISPGIRKKPTNTPQP